MLAPTTAQGIGSPTFSPPATDFSISVPELWDYQAEHSPAHPVFRYEADNALQEVAFSKLRQAIHRAGSIISTGISTARSVVGIVAMSDTTTYAAVIFGIMRAGAIPFPISHRNSPVALAHLLRRANCNLLITSSETAVENLVSLALKDLEQEISTMPMPTFEDLYQESDVTQLPALGKVDLGSPALMLHSSGSTSLPRVITYTHRIALEMSYMPYHGEGGLCGETISGHGLPIFHVMGLAPILWGLSTGLTVAVTPPTPFSTLISPQSVLSSCIATRCSIVLCVPSFLETWASDLKAIEFLKGTTSVLVAGGPLQQEIGDYIVSKGVSLASGYGTTEVGGLTAPIPGKCPPEGWNWMKASPHVDIKFVPSEGLEDIFLLHVKNSPVHTLAVTNTTIDGVAAYNTNDLVILHPKNPNVFRLYGRDDDQITHSTGEKTNPAPIEGVLLKDPRISRAIMFGRAEFQAGVIIEPSSPNAFNPKDAEQLAEFRNQIWPTVNKANENAPRHSRIFKEMILVADPKKPFELTPKGTPRRETTLAKYAEEINDAYRAVERIQRTDTVFPAEWNIKHITDFVRRVVLSVMDSPVNDTDDLVQYGADSLSAVSIRASIVDALRRSGRVPVQAIRSLPTSLVYDLPTIQAISACIYGILLASVPVQSETAGTRNNEGAPFDEESTILKLRTREDEPPLIILPGAGGAAALFLPYEQLFQSSVWTIQITEETPYTSVADQAAFFHSKIKEQQPKGPYRLAAYSGSTVTVVYLTRLFEDAGDEVVQLAMLDHFPAIFTQDSSGSQARADFIKASAQGMCALLRKDELPRAQKFADELEKAFNRRHVNPAFQHIANRAEKFVGMMFDSLSNGPSSLMEHLGNIRAPVSVYIAKAGIQLMLPDTEEWKDLGIRKYFPDAKIVYCEGGHQGLLEDDNLIRGLQEGYI